jgi:uroporphyrinogen decarboxylase
MNVIEVRKCFPGLQILGGIDKRTLASDKNAIGRELTRKLHPLVARGSYNPYCGHSVPPDVS